MTPEKAVELAVHHIGSMQALAEKLGVTKGAVSQWKLPGRRVPAEHCPQIERLTGGEVCCEDLRPDVDWKFIRTGECEASPARRSTDPEPSPGRAGRNPPSADKIMACAVKSPKVPD
jgi:DNA-binding transcriptional regulator YdaS (Cro superfamily)